MSEGVAAGIFVYSGFQNGLFYGALHEAFVEVPATLFSGLRISPAVFLEEDPLPFELFGGIGELSLRH